MNKNRSYPASDLWKRITGELFSSEIDDTFISTFRSPQGANKRLAVWDPYEPSTRYLKFLLFNVAQKKPPEFFESYAKLSNTQLGNPICVKVKGCLIDIDYLSSIEEFIFFKEHADLKNIRHVVEIGAGFGRTCHAFLALADVIESYTIIDLPEMIALSSKFLQQAIPEHYHKVKFVENIDEQHILGLNPDLTINIDSFQEMPVAVIDQYMTNIISRSKWFYSKNAIGKYSPESVGLMAVDAVTLAEAYSLGYSREVYDLFDDEILEKARIQHCLDYLPSGWKICANNPSELFPYFQHILYSKSPGD